MTKYLVLYRSTVSAAEQMSQNDPAQAEAGMKAWMEWAHRAGDAVVDLGSPLGVVEPGGDAGDPIGGYSILQAGSADELAALLRDHPHTAWGGTVETLQMLSIPGT
jgi:hypothetical protein